jgi:hypothetical protein
MALADDLDVSLGGPRSKRAGGPRGCEGGPIGYNHHTNRISLINMQIALEAGKLTLGLDGTAATPRTWAREG